MAAVRHIEKTEHVISLLSEELEGETMCYFSLCHYKHFGMFILWHYKHFGMFILASNSKMTTVRHIEHTSFLDMLLWISLSFK